MSRDSFSTCQSFSITYPKKVNKLKDYLDTTWLIVPPTFTTTRYFFPHFPPNGNLSDVYNHQKKVACCWKVW